MTSPRDSLSTPVSLIARGGTAFPLRETRDGAAERLQKQQAAQEFASLLFLEVLKAMRATIPAAGLGESDTFAADAYMSLADVEVARSMAQKEGMGLTKFIERALDVYDRLPKSSISREAIATIGVPHPPHTKQPEAQKDSALPSSTTDLTAESALPPDASPSLPVAGRITSHFGFRNDPLGRGLRKHTGIDIAAPAGTPVKAMAAGTVVFSGSAGGYGNLIAIDHGNGLTTRYGHNRALLASVGERVVPGQEIAQVGSTGRSTGPHLHFEVRRDGHAVDPLAEIAKFPSMATVTARGVQSTR